MFNLSLFALSPRQRKINVNIEHSDLMQITKEEEVFVRYKPKLNNSSQQHNNAQTKPKRDTQTIHISKSYKKKLNN